jgi:hypothetical protein
VLVSGRDLGFGDLGHLGLVQFLDEPSAPDGTARAPDTLGPDQYQPDKAHRSRPSQRLHAAGVVAAPLVVQDRSCLSPVPLSQINARCRRPWDKGGIRAGKAG